MTAIYRCTPTPLGVQRVGFVCGCGYATGWFAQRDEVLASDEMREHWAAVHAAELHAMGKGPCGRCGLITDHVQVKSELGDGWFCEDHAPSRQLLAMFQG